MRAGQLDHADVAVVEVGDSRAQVEGAVDQRGQPHVVAGAHGLGAGAGDVAELGHGLDHGGLAAVKALAQAAVEHARGLARVLAPAHVQGGQQAGVQALDGPGPEVHEQHPAVGLHEPVLQPRRDAEVLDLDGEGLARQVGGRRLGPERAQRGDDDRARAAEPDLARDRRAQAQARALRAGAAGGGAQQRQRIGVGVLGRMHRDRGLEVREREREHGAAVAV